MHHPRKNHTSRWLAYDHQLAESEVSLAQIDQWQIALEQRKQSSIEYYTRVFVEKLNLSPDKARKRVEYIFSDEAVAQRQARRRRLSFSDKLFLFSTRCKAKLEAWIVWLSEYLPENKN